MFKKFDLAALRRDRQIAYYFRYPLYHSDFRELRVPPNRHLVGRFAAKPLYGRLTPDGQVDKRAGLNGKIAIVFLPARARSPSAARLFLTRTNPERLLHPSGKRNWQAIRAAAQRYLVSKFRAKKRLPPA